MTYSEMMEWVEAKPFEPFRLVMTDGGSVDVRNPRVKVGHGPAVPASRVKQVGI